MNVRRAGLDRFVCDLDVELDTGRVRVSGRGLDLGETAVSCATDSPIQPGTTVQVRLRLVLEWGTSEPVAVSGHVLWMTESEGSYQHGVMLTELGNDVRQRLAVLLKVLTGQIALPATSR